VRALVACACASAVALSACGGAVTPPPPVAPSTNADTARVQIFYARADEPPLPVALEVAAALTVDGRIRARFAALSAAAWSGPDGSFNVLRDSARVSTVAVDGDLAVLDFAVAEGEWGLADREALRAFVEQVVFTATDEKAVHRVRLTQNGGQDAVITSSNAVVRYLAALTREIVSPDARPDHSVAYFARGLGPPLAVFLEGAGLGSTPEERIRSRLAALENGPSLAGADAFNVVAAMKARLRSVTIEGDLVTIDYRVPADDWGVNGSTAVRALVQQLIFTASEEPGIVRVLITQNGERGAVIGGEGLIVDRPQTRRGLLGD
jgi:spore germination protein GerM